MGSALALSDCDRGRGGHWPGFPLVRYPSGNGLRRHFAGIEPEIVPNFILILQKSDKQLSGLLAALSFSNFLQKFLQFFCFSVSLHYNLAFRGGVFSGQ